MKWVEIIELRSSKKDRVALEKELRDLFDNQKIDGKLQAVRVYSHSNVETDLSVQLFFVSNRGGIDFSTLGLSLTSAFREFGLVNHNIWIEKCSREAEVETRKYGSTV